MRAIRLYDAAINKRNWNKSQMKEAVDKIYLKN